MEYIESILIGSIGFRRSFLAGLFSAFLTGSLRLISQLLLLPCIELRVGWGKANVSLVGPLSLQVISVDGGQLPGADLTDGKQLARIERGYWVAGDPA